MGLRFSIGAEILFLLRNVQTGSEVYAAPYLLNQKDIAAGVAADFPFYALLR